MEGNSPDISPSVTPDTRATTTPVYGRRKFLKNAGAGLFGLSPLAPKPPEKPLEHQLRLASLRITPEYTTEDEAKQGYAVLNLIRGLLAKERVNLVVTPEFSFHPYHSDSFRIMLDKKWGRWKLNPSSSATQKHIILNARLLAAQHRSSLLLSTFPETGVDGKYYNTMLHIDANGDIIGVNRKFHPPMGDFTIRDALGKSFRVLPLICGEAWRETKSDTETGQNYALPPPWVKKGAPYDILAHSLSQGDLNFNELVGFTQQSLPANFTPTFGIDSLRSAFSTYYREYMPYLRRGAPIVAADWSTAGVMNGDLQPFENLKETATYTLLNWKVPPVSYSA